MTLGCWTQEEHCICIFSLAVSLCPPKFFFPAKVAINFQNLRLPVSSVTIGQSQGQYFTAHVKLLCREAILVFLHLSLGEITFTITCATFVITTTLQRSLGILLCFLVHEVVNIFEFAQSSQVLIEKGLPRTGKMSTGCKISTPFYFSNQSLF